MIFAGRKNIDKNFLQQTSQEVILPLGKAKSHLLAFPLKEKKNEVSEHLGHDLYACHVAQVDKVM